MSSVAPPALAALAALSLLCLAPTCDPGSGGGSDNSSDDSETADASAEERAARQRDAWIEADCSKRGACTVANGFGHSQSECVRATVSERERAESLGCAQVYDAYLRCLAGLSYDCSLAVAAQIQEGCGAHATALANCP